MQDMLERLHLAVGLVMDGWMDGCLEPDLEDGMDKIHKIHHYQRTYLL